jgi:hypothetical protein
MGGLFCLFVILCLYKYSIGLAFTMGFLDCARMEDEYKAIMGWDKVTRYDYVEKTFGR